MDIMEVALKNDILLITLAALGFPNLCVALRRLEEVPNA